MKNGWRTRRISDRIQDPIRKKGGNSALPKGFAFLAHG
jgi:hypothetical protein